MMDFHQSLITMANDSKRTTCWKIRYGNKYLRMPSGKESWGTKGYAEAALVNAMVDELRAYSYGYNSLSEYQSNYYNNVWSRQWPITRQDTQKARYAEAKKELLKLVEFVELEERVMETNEKI